MVEKKRENWGKEDGEKVRHAVGRQAGMEGTQQKVDAGRVVCGKWYGMQVVAGKSPSIQVHANSREGQQGEDRC